ncbi:MAG: hypothetical protein L6Q31_03940 [Fimbriimonadaceae bacterium]|uniref:Cell division protein FtsL n=1 Tax=Candidatus Nitrosymbiomonas proteolyticus TaxID=2608984 RepID=A0A809SDT8_9BACT|nr:hypothetical protein [Fimbriimonadaceae bacterium]MCK6631508.1 hypothetical protein [Fimbriimonadaceae bacterium]NUM39430.1 hypothetical protein [Armatimonadota bacterium]BBO23324.1 conserved hypothetical protein [Candidatus Nitrosymbiomonas proteolyticus]
MKRSFGWTLALLAFAVALGAALSFKPWQAYVEQKSETEDQRKAMRALEAEKARLIEERGRSESAVGVEQLAREQGFHRPEEVPPEKVKGGSR